MSATARQQQGQYGGTDIPASARVKEVPLGAMLTAAFNKKASVYLHRRSLRGDFNAVATKFSLREAGEKYSRGGFFHMSEAEVRDWSRDFTGAEKIAADAVLSDMALLRRGGVTPMLRIISAPDEADHSFHADPLHTPYGRILCCYNGPVTQGLAPEDAEAAGGEYAAKAGARIFSFAPGDIWRHAPRGFESSFAPFIHASPSVPDGAPPRMLLVGDIMDAQPKKGLWQRAKAKLGFT